MKDTYDSSFNPPARGKGPAAHYIDGYNLTTAEIIYHMPDNPHILQSYIWQDYDIAPRFPVLGGFLAFWVRELDSPLHSIILAEQKILKPGDFHHYSGEYRLQ